MSGAVVKGEEEDRAGNEKIAVKSRRENEHKRREPDQVLSTDTRREHKEHNPGISQRIDKLPITQVSSAPCDEKRSSDNDDFESGDDKILRRIKLKKRNLAEVSETSQSEKISYPPDAPVAPVAENVFCE